MSGKGGKLKELSEKWEKPFKTFYQIAKEIVKILTLILNLIVAIREVLNG